MKISVPQPRKEGVIGFGYPRLRRERRFRRLDCRRNEKEGTIRQCRRGTPDIHHCATDTGRGVQHGVWKDSGGTHEGPLCVNEIRSGLEMILDCGDYFADSTGVNPKFAGVPDVATRYRWQSPQPGTSMVRHAAVESGRQYVSNQPVRE